MQRYPFWSERQNTAHYCTNTANHEHRTKNTWWPLWISEVAYIILALTFLLVTQRAASLKCYLEQEIALHLWLWCNLSCNFDFMTQQTDRIRSDSGRQRWCTDPQESPTVPGNLSWDYSDYGKIDAIFWWKSLKSSSGIAARPWWKLKPWACGHWTVILDLHRVFPF